MKTLRHIAGSIGNFFNNSNTEYDNPHERTLPVVAPARDNYEALIVRIENMDPADTSPENVGIIVGSLKELYATGRELSAIGAIERLARRTILSGNPENANLLNAISAEINKPAAVIDGGGDHYSHFARCIQTSASLPHSPDAYTNTSLLDRIFGR